MLKVRPLLIDECPSITHIEPTKMTDKQGSWRIFTIKDKLDTVSNWLKANLAPLVSSLKICIPVPGFDTPRLVLSNQISSLHVVARARVVHWVDPVGILDTSLDWTDRRRD
jgi:hypothetical protein